MLRKQKSLGSVKPNNLSMKLFIAFLILLFVLLTIFALSACTFSVGTENGKFVSQIKGNKSVTINETEYTLDTLTGCYCPVNKLPQHTPAGK